MKLSTAAASLLLFPSFLVSAQDDCADIAELGTPSLDGFDYSISMDVDDDCEFVVKLSFKHDEALPIPTNPAAQCNPSIRPPEIAADGKPYFAGRWFYQGVPDDIKEVTGIDHVSIDWNPCGHPPANIFGVPHYDVHMYRESPEFRTCMTCTTPSPGSPVCDPTPGAQTTPNGQAFFDVTTVAASAEVQRAFDSAAQPINMPEGFLVKGDTMLQLMAGHAWNPNQEPTSGLEWDKPIFIMGPYAGTIVHWEPMVPLVFMAGDEDHEYSETLSYVDQTIDELPSSYNAKYDAKTKMATFTFAGSSVPGSCEKKVEVPIEDSVDEDPVDEDHVGEDHDHDHDMDEDMADSGSVGVLLSLAVSVISIVTPSLMLL